MGPGAHANLRTPKQIIVFDEASWPEEAQGE